MLPFSIPLSLSSFPLRFHLTFPLFPTSRFSHLFLSLFPSLPLSLPPPPSLSFSLSLHLIISARLFAFSIRVSLQPPSSSPLRLNRAVTSLSWDAILPSDNRGPPLSSLYTATSPPGFSDPPAESPQGSPARILLPLAHCWRRANSPARKLTRLLGVFDPTHFDTLRAPPFCQIAASFVNVNVVTARETTVQRKLRWISSRFSEEWSLDVRLQKNRKQKLFDQ